MNPHQRSAGGGRVPGFRGSVLKSCSVLAVLSLIPWAGPIAGYGAEVIPGLAVEARRPVFPLLIRNHRGPLVRVTVGVGKVEPSDVFERNDVRLESISFALEGTDDLGDIDSLELLSSGNDEKFRQRLRHSAHESIAQESMPAGIGQPAAPAATVTFYADKPLDAGKNVFWLSCRLKDSADLSHKVIATCTAVATSAGQLVPSDKSPRIRQRIGVALRRHGDDGVDTYRIPALTATPKGTLLCVYDMRWRPPGHDLQDHITTGLSRSTDGGKTWEPVRVIMEMGEYGGLPREQNGCSDPGIIVDQQTGEIFSFSTWIHGKPGHHQWVGTGSEPGFEIGKSAQFLMVRSRDDGRSWSQPENMTRKLKRAEWWLLATSPQAGIQLVDGTLVMPVQGRDENQKEFSTLMTSRDHGANWTVGTPASRGVSECEAAALDDGSIMLNMRNEAKDDTFHYRAVYVTRDLGRTWQPHGTDRNRLIEPGCNGSLLRFDYDEAGEKKHVLLFSNPHTWEGRTHQTVQVSFDDGLTWPRENYFLLDEGLGAGYPSLTRVDDRHVGIVYEGSQSDLVFQVLALDELLRR